MNPDVQRLLELLATASAAVESGYFYLTVAGQDAPIFRERVYAYELYHQLRCIWPGRAEWDYILNGEVDKRGHPLPEMRGPFIRSRIPDLLVHRPGDMLGNLAIIEIKSGSFQQDVLLDDVRKLCAFCGAPDYKSAILLVFGVEQESGRALATVIEEFLETNCPAELRGRVLVLIHERPGVAARRVR
jgi:hypothetical protein